MLSTCKSITNSLRSGVNFSTQHKGINLVWVRTVITRVHTFAKQILTNGMPYNKPAVIDSDFAPALQKLNLRVFYKSPIYFLIGKGIEECFSI